MRDEVKMASDKDPKVGLERFYELCDVVIWLKSGPVKIDKANRSGFKYEPTRFVVERNEDAGVWVFPLEEICYIERRKAT